MGGRDQLPLPRCWLSGLRGQPHSTGPQLLLQSQRRWLPARGGELCGFSAPVSILNCLYVPPHNQRARVTETKEVPPPGHRCHLRTRWLPPRGPRPPAGPGPPGPQTCGFSLEFNTLTSLRAHRVQAMLPSHKACVAHRRPDVSGEAWSRRLAAFLSSFRHPASEIRLRAPRHVLPCKPKLLAAR